MPMLYYSQYPTSAQHPCRPVSPSQHIHSQTVQPPGIFLFVCVRGVCVSMCDADVGCGSRGGGRYTVRDVVWGSHSEPVSFPAASVQHKDKKRGDTHFNAGKKQLKQLQAVS